MRGLSKYSAEVYIEKGLVQAVTLRGIDKESLVRCSEPTDPEVLDIEGLVLCSEPRDPEFLIGRVW